MIELSILSNRLDMDLRRIHGWQDLLMKILLHLIIILMV